VTGRWQALRWAERLAAILVGGFLAWYLVRNWRQVAAFEWSVNAPRLALATACLVLSYSGFVLVWRRLLRAFGASLGVADAHRVWYVGNLARYVPGKIFQLAGTAYLARAKGVNPVVTVTSAIVAQLFVLCGAVVVAGLTLPDLTGSGAAGVRTVGYAAAAVCAVATLTPVFGVLHRFTLRATRRPELHVPIPLSERLLAMVATTACMALWGLAFSVFVTAVVEVPEGALVPLVGVAAAGYLTAYVAVFVPAGLGVREGVFAVLLASYIPTSVAIAVAILSRLWLTLVEIAVVAFLLARYGTADLRAGAPSAHG
jgi:uncharacterized membrane protein YbhN (UPF0104 family)